MIYFENTTTETVHGYETLEQAETYGPPGLQLMPRQEVIDFLTLHNPDPVHLARLVAGIENG